VFSINYSLGPLLVAIGRMMKDIALFLVIFALFFISFSLSFMSLTREVVSLPELFLDHEKPTGNEWYQTYPVGTFGLAYWGFLGEFGESFTFLGKTNLGMILLGVYLVLSNILLVNLLIAMMADTYSTIRDNADKQWKFSRYFLVKEYRTSTLCPPPLNLALLSYRIIVFYFQNEKLEEKSISNLLKYLADSKDGKKKEKKEKKNWTKR